MKKRIHQPRRRRVEPRRLLQVRQPRPSHILRGAERVQQRAFAAGADAGDFIERALNEFLLALGAMRADREATRST